jgi:pre-mRNA-splicing helicase BRR2
MLYRPKTKETRLIYEQILALIQRHVGDLSTDDLKSATDEVLAVLKSEDLNDSQRKQEIEGIVDRLSDENFNTLVVLG